jgi:hypothetical protein
MGAWQAMARREAGDARESSLVACDRLACRRVDIEESAPTVSIANAPEMRQNLMSLAR